MIRDYEGVGLVIDGHDTPRADVLAMARIRLIDVGGHHLDVDDALVDRKNLVARAWWGGDDVGFCTEDHPDAQPVTVVHC